MNTLHLAQKQTLFELRSFFRNRAGMGFTFVFPIMFLLVFGLSSSGRTQHFNGGDIPFIQFFLGGIIAYGLIGATYTNLAMRVVNLRDTGVLKRVKGTPLPPSAYFAGHIGSAVAVSMVLTVITTVVAMVVYGAHVPLHTSLALLCTIIIGGASFCAIGLTMASIVPNADSAPAIVNIAFLPLAFISDIFYSMDGAPAWLHTVATFFPVKHLANALQVVFDPRTTGLGFRPTDLAVVALWGIVAATYCRLRFRWEVSRSGG